MYRLFVETRDVEGVFVTSEPAIIYKDTGYAGAVLVGGGWKIITNINPHTEEYDDKEFEVGRYTADVVLTEFVQFLTKHDIVPPQDAPLMDDLSRSQILHEVGKYIKLLSINQDTQIDCKKGFKEVSNESLD